MPALPKNASLMDRMIREMEDKVMSKLTLQLMDKEKNLYLFGTKRVTAKVINEKLMVRVGGGFMPFEEFYILYAEQEQEKLNRMSPQPSP
jgi:hypothetical protein